MLFKKFIKKYWWIFLIIIIVIIAFVVIFLVYPNIQQTAFSGMDSGIGGVGGGRGIK